MSTRKHSILNRFFSAAAVLIILGLLAYMAFDLLHVDNANSRTDPEMDEAENRADEIDVLTEQSDPDSLETGEGEGNSSEESSEYLPEENEADCSEETGASELKVIADGDYLLALVTKQTTLRRDYEPDDLVPVPAYMHPARPLQLRQEAMENLEALWSAAEQDGITLHIISAYRSFSYQEGLFQSYADKYGLAAASRFSAKPGQSEHQLGTVVDFGGTEVDLKAEFAATEQGRWLAENAHLYGFALSYPRGGEEVTGYIFEPWHYRYIGREAALQWKNSGKILQEFLEEKPRYFE